MTVTSNQCLLRFGDPSTEKYMVLFPLSTWQPKIHSLPGRVYCNKLLPPLLAKALDNVIARGLQEQIKTWDGCFQIRNKRGAASPSLHSWGLAIDINAAWNQFGKPPTMSLDLVKCFTDAGFEWGGRWHTPDGMHFQIGKL